MTRVAIIGAAGGGKSTLARALAARHGLPVVEIDQILWRPGWVRTPQAEFDAAHDRAAAAPRWVIDGVGDLAATGRRLAAATEIVFVDLPFATHLWWAAKRQIRAVLVGRPDGPTGCPMWRVTWRLFAMMFWFEREMRPQLAAMAAARAAAGGARLIHLRTAAELSAFQRDPV